MSKTKQHPLRLNVGFLLHQGAGTSQEFELDFPALQVGDDLDLSFLRGILRLTRTGEGLYIEGPLESEAELDCDRCLTPLKHPLAVELGELLYYPPRPGSDASEGVPATGILDLRPLVREHFLLDMPMHALCRSDCKGLCTECGGNLNETICEHPETELDPRFAALKSLLQDS
ncbi:MAG: hypothetical protein BMS9Abin28_2607 [Anaerolineae bacterium]|nr:MAG: hypothetical protein BMS9Abin28_2607 [Anaerolineae bacterium]